MSMSLVKRDEVSIDGLESVLLEGDLGKLGPEQRVMYYQRVCESVGLNPLTQPFEYLKLQGKTILYARRACTDQLRQIHRISVSIVSREKVDGIYVVTARAQGLDGRVDESVGAVPVEGLKGESLANALMKAETKAKRRVTLAICGLSMMDETEVDSLGPRAVREAPRARTLDDVAGPAEAVVEAVHEPAQASIETQHDEYGIPVPKSACPVFSSGVKYGGQRWDAVPAGWIEKMYGERGAEMSSIQTEWAEYIMARRQARKAREQQDSNAEKVV